MKLDPLCNESLQRLRGLKPHNMTEEAWLQAVAKEKLKIAERGN